MPTLPPVTDDANAVDRLLGHAGNDTLDALDGVTDARINCDGGANDTAVVDPSDPAPIDCEAING